MSSARRNDGIRRAVAARERGRAKVRSTTTTVTVASVVTAGALALALPGSSHTTSTSSSSSGSGSTSANSLGLQLRFGFQLHRFRFQLRELRLQLHVPVPAPPARVQLHELRIQLYELRLELRWLQLRLVTHFQLRRQPGHLGRLLMPATATDAEADASASWRALGTLVQLVVTDPAALPEARRLLEDDLAAVDAACSRFRRRLRDPIAKQAAGSTSARCWPRPSAWRCGRPG